MTMAGAKLWVHRNHYTLAPTSVSLKTDFPPLVFSFSNQHFQCYIRLEHLISAYIFSLKIGSYCVVLAGLELIM